MAKELSFIHEGRSRYLKPEVSRFLSNNDLLVGIGCSQTGEANFDLKHVGDDLTVRVWPRIGNIHRVIFVRELYFEIHLIEVALPTLLW